MVESKWRKNRWYSSRPLCLCEIQRRIEKITERKIDELGGEEYTREVKKQTGKSKADLYWNPKTGNVYSVPKHGGEAEWVDKVDVD